MDQIKNLFLVYMLAHLFFFACVIGCVPSVEGAMAYASNASTQVDLSTIATSIVVGGFRPRGRGGNSDSRV